MVPKPEIPADIAANYKQVLPFLSYHDDMGGVGGFLVMFMAMIFKIRDNKDSTPKYGVFLGCTVSIDAGSIFSPNIRTGIVWRLIF